MATKTKTQEVSSEIVSVERDQSISPVLQVFLDSKQFVKPNSALVFDHPHTIFDKFATSVGNTFDIFDAVLSNPVVNKNEDGTENISYGRVILEARSSTLEKGREREVIALALNFVNQLPYGMGGRGSKQTICANMNIMGSSCLRQFPMTADFSQCYEQLKEWGENAEQHFEEVLRIVNELENDVWDINTLYRNLGKTLHLVQGNKYRMGTSELNEAAALMLDHPTSMYAVRDDHTTALNFHNVLTDVISREQKYIDSILPKSFSAYEIIRELPNIGVN